MNTVNLYSTVTEALIEARSVLVRRGLNQGGYENAETGRVCAAGAVRLALYDEAYIAPSMDPASDPTRSMEMEVYHLLSAHIPLGDIVSFNDTPGRTVEEVLAVFDKAIEASQQPTKESQ